MADPMNQGASVMANQNIRVGPNGYGVIGKRVADAVALQADMLLQWPWRDWGSTSTRQPGSWRTTVSRTSRLVRRRRERRGAEAGGPEGRMRERSVGRGGRLGSGAREHRKEIQQ